MFKNILDATVPVLVVHDGDGSVAGGWSAENLTLDRDEQR